MFSSKLNVMVKTSLRTITTAVASSASLKPYIANFPPKPLIVTITGAYSKTGQYIAFLLKQFPIIDELRLFDFKEKVQKVVTDLNLIDTCTKVRAYCGAKDLIRAIKDCHIVLVSPEDKNAILRKEEQLFEFHAEDVRYIALHTSEFNPEAVLCIATQPVNSLIPMVSEEYKKSRNFNSRKIIGITTVDVLRASTMVANCLNTDPQNIFCPVIGGSSSKSTVAVLSYVKPLQQLANYNKKMFQEIQSELSNVEPNILTEKNDDNDKSPQISRAYAAARFVMQVCRGLKGNSRFVDCGFVSQMGPAAEFLPYMSTVIKLGPRGIERVYMPKLNMWEGERLSLILPNIRKDIEQGVVYATGTRAKKIVKQRRCYIAPCNTVIAQTTANISKLDVDLVPKSKQIPDQPPKNPRYLYS